MSSEDKKISELYQALESSEPPAHLDKTILAASRHAIKHRSRARGPFSGGWPVTVSVAALVLFTIVVVPITMHEITPEPGVVAIDSQDKMLAPKKKTQPSQTRRREPSPVAETENRGLSNQIEAESPALAATPQVVGPAKNIRQATESGGPVFGALSDNGLSGLKALNGRLAKQAAAEQEYLGGNKAEQKMARMPASRAMSEKPGKLFRTADDWLKTIKQLLDNNETDKARKEYEDFKKAYPDYTVDTKLLNRLK